MALYRQGDDALAAWKVSRIQARASGPVRECGVLDVHCLDGLIACTLRAGRDTGRCQKHQDKFRRNGGLARASAKNWFRDMRILKSYGHDAGYIAERLGLNQGVVEAALSAL